MHKAAINNDTELIYILLIESGNNKIENLFKYCQNLTQIALPPIITEIGANSFFECKSLYQISIPPSVKSIGNSAFEYCSSLKQVKIPFSVERIGKSAFENCYSLKQVTIPSSVKLIDDYAFKNCLSLSKIIIPSSVKSIGDHVFKKCNLLNEYNSDSDDTHIKHSKLNIGAVILLSVYSIIVLTCLFAIFMISIVWWSRIHPWFLHGYKTGKTVYLTLEICWISELCIFLLFLICFLMHLFYEKYRKRILIMKNRTRFREFIDKFSFFVIKASIVLGLISFLCSFIVSYFALKNDEVDGKSIKCLNYILNGDEGAKNWVLTQFIKKQNEFKKWHSEMLNKAYQKDGNPTNYYCHTVGIPMLIFSCLPFVIIILGIFIMVIYYSYLIYKFSLYNKKK